MIRTIAELEKEAIENAMRELDGNVIKVAEALGISRNTVRRKLREYGYTIYWSYNKFKQPSRALET